MLSLAVVFLEMRNLKSGATLWIGIFLLTLPLLLSAGGCRSNHAQPPANSSAEPASALSSPRQTATRTEIGFATQRKFLDHFDKHGAEFGSIGKEEYLRRAQTLRDAHAGGGILESVRRDGVVTRFDRETGAFLAFNADLTIRTFFKPNDGENYFRRKR